MSTRPKSLPRPNCIKAMAISPPIVVRLLEDISGMPFVRASIIACLGSECCFSSAKRLHKMTA